MVYSMIVFVHVLSAILSIGPFFVLLPLVRKMRLTNDLVVFGAYLEAFQIGVTIVKHAGHVLITFGLIAVWLGPWELTTSWILVTIIMLLVAVFYLATAFKPTIRTFQTERFNQPQFVKKLKRGVIVYIVLLLIMLWLMVAKPVLW